MKVVVTIYRCILLFLALFLSMSCTDDSARINLCKVGSLVGNNSANYELFHHYRYIGKLEKAIEHAIQAATDGHIETQYELGMLLLEQKKFERAFFWFSEASKQELGIHAVAACHNLGIMYGFGLGVEKNREKSLEYFQMSAEADSDFFDTEKFLKNVEELGFEMAMEQYWPEIKTIFMESEE